MRVTTAGCSRRHIASPGSSMSKTPWNPSWPARTEYLPVRLAMAASGALGALEQHEFLCHDFGGQRPDSQRDRHELRHRCAGTVQPRRTRRFAALPRLLSQNLQAVGTGRHLPGHVGNFQNYTPAFPRPRTQPLDALPRRRGLSCERKHGQHLFRRLVHAVRFTDRGDVEREVHSVPLTADSFRARR